MPIILSNIAVSFPVVRAGESRCAPGDARDSVHSCERNKRRERRPRLGSFGAAPRPRRTRRSNWLLGDHSKGVLRGALRLPEIAAIEPVDCVRVGATTGKRGAEAC